MKKFFLGSALLLLSLMGCAYKTVQVNYLRPAEVNLKGHKQIAVGGVYGGGGPYDMAATTMKARLEEAIFNSGRFTLINQAQTQTVISQLALFNSGIYDTTKAPELGKLLPATIFIYATINRHDWGTRVDREERKTAEGVVYYYYKRTTWAEVEVSFQVIDCETGVVLALKTLKDRTQDTYGEDNNANIRDIPHEPLLDSARNMIIADFMKVIAPYEAQASVRFAKHKKVPQVAQGINQIKIGDWSGATQTFEAAYAANPNDDRIMYNLGLVYEYTYQFDRAEELFKKAYTTKPNGAYQNELANCARLKQEYQKLQDQTPE